MERKELLSKLQSLQAEYGGVIYIFQVTVKSDTLDATIFLTNESKPMWFTFFDFNEEMHQPTLLVLTATLENFKKQLDK